LFELPLIFILAVDPTMKKLLAIFCCLFSMRGITQSSTSVTVSSTSSGEKVLVKAITAIVNREGKKKQPLRKINLSSFEYP